MPTYTLFERWQVDVPADQGKTWFAGWVNQSPKQASRHLTAGWNVLNSLANAGLEPFSCREYFSGIGGQAMAVNEIFPFLGTHVVQDYSPEAVEHLSGMLPGFITVRQQDAYAPGSDGPEDLQVLDFGDFTARWFLPGEQKRELLDRVFAHKPQAVVMTDVAGPYLHLQRHNYENIMGDGSAADYSTYIENLMWMISRTYGYHPGPVYSHRWSTVMSFTADDLRIESSVAPIPPHPVGLELRS